MMQRLGSNISRRAARINGANADSEYDLHHMASMIACLTKAVALDKQGVLAPRQRIAATRALEWLVQFAKRSMAGEVVTSLAMDESIAVRVALVQVYSLAMLAVSEAGGAASAAASHNHPAGSQRAHVSLHTGSARTGAGWVETLQYSSELIHSVLNSKQLADPPPSPDPLPNGGPNGNGQAAVNRNFRCACFKLAAALLRSDAIASLSRLLAAEEHRGTFFAVLGTGATVDILRPLLDLVRISRRAPTEVLSFGDRQQELLCPAVLRALAVSGVVEHVCRFAVTRLVDPGRGTGRAAYQYHEHASCVRGLVEEVSLLACKALAQGWGDPADTWTVLMSPCFQVGWRRAWQGGVQSMPLATWLPSPVLWCRLLVAQCKCLFPFAAVPPCSTWCTCTWCRSCTPWTAVRRTACRTAS